ARDQRRSGAHGSRRGLGAERARCRRAMHDQLRRAFDAGLREHQPGRRQRAARLARAAPRAEHTLGRRAAQAARAAFLGSRVNSMTSSRGPVRAVYVCLGAAGLIVVACSGASSVATPLPVEPPISTVVAATPTSPTVVST